MKLGTLDIIGPDGVPSDGVEPLMRFNPTARTFWDALLAFLARRLVAGRTTTLYIPASRDDWFSDLADVRAGTRDRASLLLDAVLDGLTGGVLIHATLAPDGRSFTFDISTHT